MNNFYCKAKLAVVCYFLLAAGCAIHRMHDSEDQRCDAGAGNESQDIYYRILQAHYLSFSGRIEEARKIFSQSLEEFPLNADLHYQYAKFLLDLSYRTNDQEHALALIKTARDSLMTATSLDNMNTSAMELLSEIQIELGDFKQAVVLLEKLMTIIPSDQKIMGGLARLYVHIKQPQKAIDLLKPFIGIDELDNYDILKVYALACGESEQLAEAISNYERYLEHFPGEFEASFNLSLCHFRSGNLLHASEILEELRRSGHFTIEVAELYTDVLKAQGRHEDAIALLQEIGKDSQIEVGANIEIGQIYLTLGNPESAYKHLIRAVTKAPDDRRATFYTAVALSEMGMNAEALKMLEGNLRDRPISIASADLASSIFVEVNQIDSAVAICIRLLNEREKDIRTYLICVKVYESADLSEELMNTLRAGVKEFPESLPLNMALAYRMDLLGDWKEAIRIAERFRTEVPGNPEIDNFIGFVLAERNEDLSRALELIQSALKQEPENPAYIDSLAWVYYRMKRLDDAILQIRIALEKLPDDPVVLEHFIRICFDLGLVDEARSALTAALSRFPDHAGLIECKDLLEIAND